MKIYYGALKAALGQIVHDKDLAQSSPFLPANFKVCKNSIGTLIISILCMMQHKYCHLGLGKQMTEM